MIEDLVDLLDRSWAALSAVTGVDFAIHCFPFHEQLTRDARTSALLSDLRREEAESYEQRAHANEAARARLTANLNALEEQAPNAFEAAPNDENAPDNSAAGIRRLLTPQQPPDNEMVWVIGREWNHDGRVDHAFRLLRNVAQRAEMDAIRDDIDGVRRAFDYAVRARRTFYRTSGAAALARLEVDLTNLNPPIEEDEHAWIARLGRTLGALGSIAERLFGNRVVVHSGIVSEEDKQIEARLAAMRHDVARIYEELRRRLGAERSLLAVFERYRQRCQWYDAERLRDLAERGRGQPEDRLASTLVEFLFDHGLNPLTRPLVGELSPDVLDGDGRFSFYVEAKQYNRAVRQYLVHGMQQVWDMLDQLRGTTHDVREAFYVVYRRGGPRYAFPPRVQDGDRVVHVIAIDIAPSDERGSRARHTIAIELAELAPQINHAAVRRHRTRG